MATYSNFVAGRSKGRILIPTISDWDYTNGGTVLNGGSSFTTVGGFTLHSFRINNSFLAGDFEFRAKIQGSPNFTRLCLFLDLNSNNQNLPTVNGDRKEYCHYGRLTTDFNSSLLIIPSGGGGYIEDQSGFVTTTAGGEWYIRRLGGEYDFGIIRNGVREQDITQASNDLGVEYPNETTDVCFGLFSQSAATFTDIKIII